MKRGLHPLAAAFAIAALFLSGCVQTSPPPACLGLAAQDAQNCIYLQSVLEQNPFYCYSIPDMALRSECMRHSTDPVMKRLLENTRLQPQVAPQATQPQIEPEPQLPLPPPAVSCSGLDGMALDECILEKAVNESNVAECTAISDASAKQVCISRVARATKDLESCSTLINNDDVELCRLYAGGENP